VEPSGNLVPASGGNELRVTVVVPSYNRRGPLGEALIALSQQSYPSHLFEVVVVLDGSTDGSADLASSMDTPYELRVVEQDNRGLASSRNRGAREARTGLLLFMDDDLVPEMQFLEAHVAAHRAGGPKLVVLGSCPPISTGGGLWPIYFRAIWDRHYRCQAERQHRWTYADIVGGNCSMKRSLVMDSGGWDERFTRREDWELGLRLLGEDVQFEYRPEARAWHRSESSLASELQKRQVEGRDDVYLASKHPHLKGQLPLAEYARTWESLIARVTYGSPALKAVQAALPLARALEVMRLRSAWVRLVDRLFAFAYLLGVIDGLGSPRRLNEFLGPAARRELVDVLDVTLGRDKCLGVRPTAGALDLVVQFAKGSEKPVRIPALEPEGQWEWDAIEERLVKQIDSIR
jgi:GT2 family glycosyltransferase